MLTRITIKCPNCSASLAAHGSAEGKRLLCPTCRTAIVVPGLPTAGDVEPVMSESDMNHARDLESDHASPVDDNSSPRYVSMRPLAVGLSVTLIPGLLIVALLTFQEWQKSRKIETALQAQNFDLALGLNPNHEEALIERIRLRLQLPDTNTAGAVSDLEQLRKTVPQHPIHKEILPQLTVARSMEFAADGRITAAIKELELAASLGSPELQLNVVKQHLSTLILKQIKTSLAEKHYARVISDSETIRKLVGNNPEALAIQRAALCGMADQADTDEEIAGTIQRLEELDERLNLTESCSILHSLYLKRSKLAHTQGDLWGSVDYYTDMLEHDVDDPQALQWGVSLSQATMVALEKDFSERNLGQARRLIDLLEKNFVNSASVVRLKISLADAMFLAGNVQSRDEVLDFAAFTVEQAQAIGFIVESIDGKADFRRRIADALVERGLTHTEAMRMDEGARDIATALRIFPEKRAQLLVRLDQLPAAFRQQFQVSIRDEKPNAPTDSIFDLIPAKAEAFSVVRNMQSFSGKVDHMATVMRVSSPRLLEAACRKSGINAGLDRQGSLGWVKMPSADVFRVSSEIIFFVPVLDFRTMVQSITEGTPPKDQQLIPVVMNGSKGLAAEIPSYGVFAFEKDQHSLSDTVDGLKGIQNKLLPFHAWDQDLDAYFVVTRDGIRSGLRSFQIPFSERFFELLLQQASQTALHREAHDELPRTEIQNQLQQMAVGVAIQPDLGIEVRSRVWLSLEFDLEKVLSENPGGRETALSQLPDEDFLIAVGGPISAVGSDWIMSLPELFSLGHGNLDIRISRIQAAVLAPGPLFAPEGEDGNLTEQSNTETLYRQLLNRTIVVVTVENSQTAMADLKTFFETVSAVHQIEVGELHQLPVLRTALQIGLNTKEDDGRLCIAAPDHKSLVFTYGSDREITCALKPFLEHTNLSQSESVKAAARMLPQSTSWLLAMDLRVLGKWLQAQANYAPQWEFLSSILIQENEGVLPLALGMSWEKSNADLSFSIPRETLPLAGRLALIMNLVP